MNELIRKLAEETQAQVHEIYNSMEEEPTGDFDYWFDAQFQKIFAELIIKECADQCTHDGPFTAEVVWGKQFREKILKHFGVE